MEWRVFVCVIFIGMGLGFLYWNTNNQNLIESVFICLSPIITYIIGCGIVELIFREKRNV